jgi:hypothetical protein
VLQCVSDIGFFTGVILSLLAGPAANAQAQQHIL